MRAIKKSVLLKTSAGTDIQHSGGEVSITGLPEIRYNELRKIRQIKSKDEVVQVVTVGATSYTPTANTRYAIEIVDLEMKREGYTGQTRTFGYTTPPVLTTIGSSAALQREYIHGKIIAQINATTAYTHATAVTLATGSGFTITDSSGYYPANTNGGQTRKGANVIIAKTNNDATGFVEADVTLTTAAVYAFGNGTVMAANTPIIASYTQLLVSGDLENPVATDGTYGVAGQKYDAFTISALATAPAHAVSDQYALVPQEFAVFVANGTGTVTTNLAGFKSFRREMYRLFTSLYRKNPSSVIDFFGKPIMMEGALGAAPATTGTYKLLSEEMWQEIIYDIITIATKANYTDDSIINARYIGYKVDEKRARAIHESYKRNFVIDPKWIQDFGVSNMTTVNTADDKSFGYLDCKLSKLTLPPVVYLNNNISGANNFGVHSIRSVDGRQEFYYMPHSKLMELYRLSENHPNRKFKYYTQIGNAIYIPDGPDRIHPFLILERPLDGYVRSTENIVSGSLIVGQQYIVMDKQVIHNSVPYVKDQTFTAVDTLISGTGHIQLVNQKRSMTNWDEYPMSNTMAEEVIMNILTKELRIEMSMISDSRNDSKDSLKILQPVQQ